ncbi:hypothetical protein SFRURICE_011734 [Spodoptera frugiperda]|nr:hypothetical protein SFRURICE_011734 [Spodoptera frugiperda]
MPSYSYTALGLKVTLSNTEHSSRLHVTKLKRQIKLIITVLRHTKLIILLLVYTRNCLTRNSISFKPC